MAKTLVSPREQIALDEEWISGALTAIEEGKVLLAHSDVDEVKRGLWVIGFNSASLTPHSYCIGQVKWRLGLGHPGNDLERAVGFFAKMLNDCSRYGAEVDTYWAHLVAFVAMILSGTIPAWIAETQADLSSYLHRKKRLLPWEVDLGYQTALAVALSEGKLPNCWPRFISDSSGRPGLKRIHQSILSYERLFNAVQNRCWADLPSISEECDSNYRKRGSSEASHPDIFGDGPFNERSIDYIAAAILRTVQHDAGFPAAQMRTPHIWKWETRNLSHISP